MTDLVKPNASANNAPYDIPIKNYGPYDPEVLAIQGSPGPAKAIVWVRFFITYICGVWFLGAPWCGFLLCQLAVHDALTRGAGAFEEEDMKNNGKRKVFNICAEISAVLQLLFASWFFFILYLILSGVAAFGIKSRIGIKASKLWYIGCAFLILKFCFNIVYMALTPSAAASYFIFNGAWGLGPGAVVWIVVELAMIVFMLWLWLVNCWYSCYFYFCVGWCIFLWYMIVWTIIYSIWISVVVLIVFWPLFLFTVLVIFPTTFLWTSGISIMWWTFLGTLPFLIAEAVIVGLSLRNAHFEPPINLTKAESSHLPNTTGKVVEGGGEPLDALPSNTLTFYTEYDRMKPSMQRIMRHYQGVIGNVGGDCAADGIDGETSIEDGVLATQPSTLHMVDCDDSSDDGKHSV